MFILNLFMASCGHDEELKDKTELITIPGSATTDFVCHSGRYTIAPIWVCQEIFL